MMFLTSLMVIGMWHNLATPIKGEDCVWNKDTEFPTYPPLIADAFTGASILPYLKNGTREVRIVDGAEVLISCPRTKLRDIDSAVVTGTCIDGSFMVRENTKLTMKQLGCRRRVKERVQKNIGSCAGGVGSHHTIGFNIPGYFGIELIHLCFNPDTEGLIYTHHKVRGRGVNASDSNPSRPGFRSGRGLFSVSPNKCYSIRSQQTMMAELLGSTDFIDPEQSMFLARGHAAADADFHTEMEQDATYYYMNAFPQWQGINGRNWKGLEHDIRVLASHRETDLKVWTGAWNTLRLPNSEGTLVEIFLGYTENQKVIPVPEYTWKVIYEPSSHRGLAVMVLNNPYAKEFPQPLCNDICDQIKWLEFDFRNLEAGATYCCTVQEFQRVISTAPNLGNAKLLNSV